MEWELLFKYRGHECSDAERARCDAWLAADPRHRMTLDAIVSGVDRATGDGGYGGRVVRGIRRHAGRWALLTAAAVLMATGGVRVWRAMGSRSAGGAGGSAAVRVIGTQPGERAELTLVDGTRVVLGPASVLRYAVGLGPADRRELTLDGEAYFEVAHEEGRPFRVRTAQAVAEDRGTRFDIRAYPADAEVRVVVAEGEVAVSGARAGGLASGREPALLRSGSVAYADSEGGVRVAPGVAADTYLAWTRGELRFVGTPLPEAVAELGRWYDIDLRLGDTRLETKSLTASFRGDPVDDVVHTLERVLSVRVQRDGRVMTLYPT